MAEEDNPQLLKENMNFKKKVVAVLISTIPREFSLVMEVFTEIFTISSVQSTATC